MQNRARGFTLLEVMFAIMILGIGLIAVASLFPVAGTMQRAAFEDAMTMQVSTSLEVELRSRAMSKSGWTADGQVHEIAESDLNAVWPLKDRSFPQNITNVDKRSYFWRPFYRYNLNNGPSSDPGAWELYVIISKRPEGGTAPVQASYGAGGGANDEFVLGEVAIRISDGQLGTVTQVNGGLTINSVAATASDWLHAKRMNGQPTMLDVTKISTGGVKP